LNLDGIVVGIAAHVEDGQEHAAGRTVTVDGENRVVHLDPNGRRMLRIRDRQAIGGQDRIDELGLDRGSRSVR